MSRLSFYPNSTISFRGTELLFLQELVGGLLQLMEISAAAPFTIRTEGGAPRFPTWDDLEDALSEGQLTLLRDPRGNIPTATLLRSTALDRKQVLDLDDIRALDPRAEKRQYYCRAFDELPRGLGDKELLAFISDAAASPAGLMFGKPPSVSSLRRWVKARGEIGERSLLRMVSQTGRKAKLYCFDLHVAKLLQRATAWYWSQDGRSYCDAYARFARALRLLNHLRLRAELPALKRPHFSTFARYVRLAESHASWVARYGKRRADLHWKPVGEGLSATQALEAVILDSTVLDSIAAFDGVRMLPVGRPTLVIIIDVCSRAILAILVCYEPPSTYTVTESLKRCLRPKSWRKERFPKMPHAAEIYGRPKNLILDNAWENVSPSLRDGLAELGISVEFAPIATPTYKAIGEAFFDTINKLVVHKLAGATRYPIDVLREMGFDPSKDAVLTIDQIDEIIEEAINLYHHRVHRSLGMAPAQMWAKSSVREPLTYFDEGMFDIMLGAANTRTLDRRGIYFQNLLYRDEAVVAKILANAVPRTRARGRRKKSVSVLVKIKYNPANLASIHVLDPVDGQYHQMPCTFGTYADGLTLYQHKLFRNWAKAEANKFMGEEQLLAAMNDLRRTVEAAVPSLRIKGRKRAMRLLQAPPVSTSPNTVMIATAESQPDGMGSIIVPSTDAQSNLPPMPPAPNKGRKRKTQVRAPERSEPEIASSWVSMSNADEFINRLGW